MVIFQARFASIVNNHLVVLLQPSSEAYLFMKPKD